MLRFMSQLLKDTKGSHAVPGYKSSMNRNRTITCEKSSILPPASTSAASHVARSYKNMIDRTQPGTESKDNNCNLKEYTRVPSWYNLPPDTTEALTAASLQISEQCKIPRASYLVRRLPEVLNGVMSLHEATDLRQKSRANNIIQRQNPRKFTEGHIIFDNLTQSHLRNHLRYKLWSDLGKLFGEDNVSTSQVDVNDDDDDLLGISVNSLIAEWHTPKESQIPLQLDSIVPSDDTSNDDTCFLTALPSQKSEHNSGGYTENICNLSDAIKNWASTPGSKSRPKLCELQHYVDAQLQRRLYAWKDVIKTCFHNSRELTSKQLLSCMRLYHIKLSSSDTNRIAEIIEAHANRRDHIRAIINPDDTPADLINYADFQSLFYPTDPEVCSRWEGEYVLESQRQQREEALYKVELAALEQKVKSRMAKALEPLIDGLQKYQIAYCPWESLSQRFDLYRLTFAVIFREKDCSLAEDTQDLTLLPKSLLDSGVINRVRPRFVHFQNALYRTFARKRRIFDKYLSMKSTLLFVHDFAASVVQEYIRRYLAVISADRLSERRQFLEYKQKKKFLYAWKVLCHRVRCLRIHNLRKLIVWAFRSRNKKQKKRFFRLTFWPFHVWKRTLCKRILADGKAKFLARVWTTYVKLRHIRAWKKMQLRTRYLQQLLVQIRISQRKQRCQSCYNYWKNYMQRNTRIRRIWKVYGRILHKKRRWSTAQVAFCVWRYYTFLKAELRKRMKRSTLVILLKKGLSGSSFIRGTAELPSVLDTTFMRAVKHKSQAITCCVELHHELVAKCNYQAIQYAIRFKRMGTCLLHRFSQWVKIAKKGRLATYLAYFRILNTHFSRWKIILTAQIDSKYSTSSIHSIAHQRFHWKHDTAERKDAIRHMAARSQAARKALEVVCEKESARCARFSKLCIDAKTRQSQEGLFLRLNDRNTKTLVQIATQQARHILDTRHIRLHDRISCAFDTLHHQYNRWLFRTCFRSLRAAALHRSSISWCRRAQLRNYLRICKRYQFWNVNADRLYRLRLIFRGYRAFVRNVSINLKYEWQFLRPQLSRRKQILWKHEAFIRDHMAKSSNGRTEYPLLAPIVHIDAAMIEQFSAKHTPMNTLHGRFLRWVYYTQWFAVQRQMSELYCRKQAILRMLQVFRAIKGSTSIVTHYPEAIHRCLANLDAIHSKLYALRDKFLSSHLQRHMRSARLNFIRSVRQNPTLKQRLSLHIAQVRRRLYLESRLMLTAYQERGHTHHFAERHSEIIGSKIGSYFDYHTAPGFSRVTEIVLYSTQFRIEGISVNLLLRSNEKIIGTLYGKALGTRDTFSLNFGENVTSIEGFASHILHSVRFYTNQKRHSRWFGPCDRGILYFVEGDTVMSASKEMAQEHLIGIVGYKDTRSLTGIGFVFRHTTHENIFSEYWISPFKDINGNDKHPDLFESGSTNDRQFSYFMQIRACDVMDSMRRAHEFALRLHRSSYFAKPLSARLIMALTKWLFNALSHGLVPIDIDKDEAKGQALVRDGLVQRNVGRELVQEGTQLLEKVAKYQDEDGRFNIAALGIQKVKELEKMTRSGHESIRAGTERIDLSQRVLWEGRRLLPHFACTKRMKNAVQRLYKILQTKEYIGQMDEELQSLLLKGPAASASLTIVGF